MEDNFDSMTTAHIEAKLHRDTIEHEDKVIRLWLIGIFILMYIFRGSIIYWLKFGVAFPTSHDYTPITTEAEPIQENYSDEEKAEKEFIYTSLLNKHEIKIMPQAHYKLSAMVVAHNSSFVFISDFFDSAALYDLGAAWGELGDKKFYNTYFKSYSQKTELSGSRVLWTTFKKYPAPVSKDYATSHWSHSHLVPASRNVMAALLLLKRWDKFELEGDLIDMQYPVNGKRVQKYHTSMSRTDSGWTGDRGNGSCETIYVTKLRIGNKVYE